MRFAILPTERDYFELVKSQKTWNSSIRRVRRPPAELRKDLQQVYSDFENVPGWLIPRRPKADITGTKETYAHVLKHIDNKCCSDPLPLEQMYRHVGTTVELEREEYAFMGGSGRNETTHSVINRILTYDRSQVSAKKQQRNMMLLMYRHNQKVDRKNGHEDITCPGSFFHERHLINMISAGVLSERPFPLAHEKFGATSHVDAHQQLQHVFGWDYHDLITQLKATATYARKIEELAKSTAAKSNAQTSQQPRSVSTTDAPPKSNAAAAPASGHGKHRVAKRDASIMLSLPIQSFDNESERELMVKCVTQAKEELGEGSGEGNVWKRAEAIYIGEMALNDGKPAGAQLKLTGRIDASFIEKQYKNVASAAARKRFGAPMPRAVASRKKSKSSAPSQGAAKPARSERSGVHEKYIAACLPLTYHDKGRRSAAYFMIDGKDYGRDREECTNSSKCNVCNHADTEVVKAYVRSMKKEACAAKELRVSLGGRGTKCSESKHLLEQVDTFFKHRTNKTFTPGAGASEKQ
eukprot:COSAG01_NODE_5755_length_4054_cov_11.104930_6_plen_524_part_00